MRASGVTVLTASWTEGTSLVKRDPLLRSERHVDAIPTRSVGADHGRATQGPYPSAVPEPARTDKSRLEAGCTKKAQPTRRRPNSRCLTAVRKLRDRVRHDSEPSEEGFLASLGMTRGWLGYGGAARADPPAGMEMPPIKGARESMGLVPEEARYRTALEKSRLEAGATTEGRQDAGARKERECKPRSSLFVRPEV